MRRALIAMVVFATVWIAHADERPKLSDGRPVTCRSERFNCPSYSGPYQAKRLKSCEDVILVWRTCGVRDPHDLDGDKDGHPCELDCEI